MSEEPVVYDFQAHGIRDVQQAFQTVEQTMLKAERAAIESARREVLGRLDAARDGARKRVEVEKKHWADVSKEEHSALQRTMSIANARDEIAKRSALKRKDAERDLHKELSKLEEDHTRKAREEARKRERIEADTMRDLTMRRRQFASTISGAATGSVRSIMGTAAQWGGMALTLGGGLSVATAARSAMNAESAAVSLANSLYNPGDPEQQAWLKKNRPDGRFASPQILSLARRGQALTGLGKDELARGWQDYTAKSADWKSIATPEGQETLMSLAKLAKATGSDFGQVMSAAGSLKVQNENMSAADMMSTMRAIVGQGKMGAVEIKDLAAVSAGVTSSAGQYNMDQTKAQRALLGLSQIAIQTSRSPAEAATAVARFGTDVQHHAAKMKTGLGINAIADPKTGALKAPSEILAEIFEKTQGNTAKFGEGPGNVGLGRESVRIAQALAPRYREAVTAAKGQGITDEAQLAHLGAEAVKAYVQKFERAGYDQKDIDRDFAEQMATTAERFNRVTMQLSEKLEVRVIPFLEKLAVALERNEPQIEKFINAVGDAAEYLVENPFKGIGGIIAAKVTLDIGSATLGKVVGEALTKLIANSLGGQVAGGAAGSALGGVGLGGAAGVLALSALQVAELSVIAMEVQQWAVAGAKEGNLLADLTEGGGKGAEEASKRVEEARGQSGVLDVAGSTIERISKVVQLATNPLGLLVGSVLEDQVASSDWGKEHKMKTASEISLQTIKAKELIDVYDVRMEMTKAVRQGIVDGAASASDPNAAHRNGPIGHNRK